MKMTKKELFYCDFVNLWSNMFAFMRIMKDKEGMYIYELMVLSSLYTLNKQKMRPLNQNELYFAVKIQHYRFKAILDNLIALGYIRNDRIVIGKPMGVKAAYKLTVTISGEQFLQKYSKVMNKLSIGSLPSGGML